MGATKARESLEEGLCVWLYKVSSEPMHCKRCGVKSTRSMGEKEVG
jgi:hypothetical protein